jgi:molybdopterin synthase sulfur carrier subunit
MIVKFYSALREKIGKSVEINKDELDIKSLIELLDIKDYIMENNNLLTGTIVLVNGKNILHMNGLDTVVKNNDNVDFFPPAAGG